MRAAHWPGQGGCKGCDGRAGGPVPGSQRENAGAAQPGEDAAQRADRGAERAEGVLRREGHRARRDEEGVEEGEVKE